MQNCVDLFTGVGGFALALHDLYTPLLYCEKRADVRRVLAARFSDGSIPKAPVLTDVLRANDIVQVVDGRRVHLVTAGFPCVGFSAAGSKQGFLNAHSKLFDAVVDIANRLRPDAVFLENVPAILTVCCGQDFCTVLARMGTLGYKSRWLVLSAKDVGAPQLRRRWFCLCTRESWTPHPALGSCSKKETTHADRSWRDPVPPMVVVKQPVHARRFFMLGNAVVPLQARRAFEVLCDAVARPVDSRCARKGGSAKHPPHGRCDDGVTIQSCAPVTDLPGAIVPPADRAGARIVLDPTWHTPSRAYRTNSRRVPLPMLDASICRVSWPTPRATCATSSCVLNMRTIRDLATFAMFTRTLGAVEQKRTIGTDGINPAFVEWLMGFPLGHTRFD